MAIHLTCSACRRNIQAPDNFGGRKAHCPNCGTELLVPQPETEEIIEAELVDVGGPKHNPWEIKFLNDLHEPLEVTEFLEPPIAQSAPTRQKPSSGQPAEPVAQGNWVQRMLEAMLDPRSIQWLLTLGGGLMVLGLLIWLISTGIFSQPLPLAILFGLASIGLLVGGWFVALKTRYRVAGRALAFLGCVVLPLNLWFYHAQGLLLLENGLWLGGVACVFMYAVTVWVMRDPLFLYAVEVGVTLTAALLLGSMGLAGQATHVSILLMVLALASLHAYLIFPQRADLFDRKRFGLPLFWCGHVQLASAVVVLFLTQVAGWLEPVGNFFDLPTGGVLLTNSRFVSGLLWLAAAYAYLYSDLVVRRLGVYTYFAALSLVMAEFTLLDISALGAEGLIAVLALTACAVSLLTRLVPTTQPRLVRAVGPLALLLSIIPVVLGLILHIRANSLIAQELNIGYATTWSFVIAMLVVAVANRVSAYLYQNISRSLSAVYLFFSAGALIVAAAGWLRIREMDWLQQTLLLMLIPIAYLVASRLWRGRPPERPLGWIAHTATAVIFAHALVGLFQQAATDGLDITMHLLLAILLVETAVFYALAAVLRRQSANIYFAVAAAGGAVWQFMLYVQLPQPLFTIVFAIVGLAMIIAARTMGLSETQVYDAHGRSRSVTRGRGVALLKAGHGVLLTAISVAFLAGLVKLAAFGLEARDLVLADWIALGLTTIISVLAIMATPRGPWRRVYTVAAIAMGCLSFLTVTVAIDLNMWRKLEIFLVTVGVLLLGAGYVGRFREEEEQASGDMVSLGLWLGSLLTAFPLLVAVFYHWATAWEFAFYDEVVLLTFTILMLVTGILWQVKASTLLGGATLATYLVVLIVSLLYRPQVAIGIYLAAGGGVVFLLGLLLAIYRERLIALPERFAKREGLFRVISWR